MLFYNKDLRHIMSLLHSHFHSSHDLCDSAFSVNVSCHLLLSNTGKNDQIMWLSDQKPCQNNHHHHCNSNEKTLESVQEACYTQTHYCWWAQAQLTRCIPDSIHNLSQNAAPPGNLGKPLIYVNTWLLCYHCRINSLTKEYITLFTYNGVKTDHHITLGVLLLPNRITNYSDKENKLWLTLWSVVFLTQQPCRHLHVAYRVQRIRSYLFIFTYIISKTLHMICVQ